MNFTELVVPVKMLAMSGLTFSGAGGRFINLWTYNMNAQISYLIDGSQSTYSQSKTLEISIMTAINFDIQVSAYIRWERLLWTFSRENDFFAPFPQKGSDSNGSKGVPPPKNSKSKSWKYEDICWLNQLRMQVHKPQARHIPTFFKSSYILLLVLINFVLWEPHF